MSKSLLKNISVELHNVVVLNSFGSNNQLFGLNNNIKYTITVIGNDVDLVATVAYGEVLPKDWYIEISQVIVKHMPEYNLSIKESYEIVVDDKKISVDIASDSEPEEEIYIDEEEDIDDGSLESFDPMAYATSTMVGGEFMRFSKEYFGEDAKVKTPEIVIEEQKAEGLRDTSDEYLNPDPEKEVLDKLKDELTKLSEEEKQALFDEFGIESIDELYEEVETEELEEEPIQEDEELVVEPKEIIVSNVEEEYEIPDLILAETSDFEMDDYLDDEDDDIDLFEEMM